MGIWIDLIEEGDLGYLAEVILVLLDSILKVIDSSIALLLPG